jgi:hypothetical protein
MEFFLVLDNVRFRRRQGKTSEHKARSSHSGDINRMFTARRAFTLKELKEDLNFSKTFYPLPRDGL